MNIEPAPADLARQPVKQVHGAVGQAPPDEGSPPPGFPGDGRQDYRTSRVRTGLS
jgi:hypothetical protein